jgi:hypothetical protein
MCCSPSHRSVNVPLPPTSPLMNTNNNAHLIATSHQLTLYMPERKTKKLHAKVYNRICPNFTGGITLLFSFPLFFVVFVVSPKSPVNYLPQILHFFLFLLPLLFSIASRFCGVGSHVSLPLTILP